MVQDKLTDTDGFYLYAQIASIEVSEENTNLAAKKPNYKENFK